MDFLFHKHLWKCPLCAGHAVLSVCVGNAPETVTRPLPFRERGPVRTKRTQGLSLRSAGVDVPNIVLVAGDVSVTPRPNSLNPNKTDRGITEAKESNDSCGHPKTWWIIDESITLNDK